MRVSPHQLRHTFAVHMLAMLIQHRLRDAALEAQDRGWKAIVDCSAIRCSRFNACSAMPASTTTYIYLDHIAARADTVDAAVEELLALVPTVNAS